MLTNRQKDLFEFIVSRNSVGSPSYREMQEALGIASVSGVHRLVLALEERGFIRRIPNRARAIEICRMPDGTAPHAAAAACVAEIAAAGYHDAAPYLAAIREIRELAARNEVDLLIAA